MAWEQKPLLPPLPSEAQDIVNTLSTTVGTIQPVIDAAVVLLDAAKIFFVASTDLYALLMDTLITELENLINDLFGSGAFQLIINPFTLTFSDSDAPRIPKGVYGIPYITPDDAIKAAIKSFDDLGDTERPQFSDGAEVAGFAILVTAQDLALYVELLEALLSVWTIKDIDFALKKTKEKAGIGATPPSRGVDWDSIRFNDIGALRDIQDQLLSLLSIAKGYTKVPDGVDSLIDALARKLQVLSDSITTFQAVIDALSNTPALAGVHILDIPKGVGGNTRLKEELPHPFLQNREYRIFKYTFMAMYVGGGAGADPVDNVRALIV